MKSKHQKKKNHQCAQIAIQDSPTFPHYEKNSKVEGGKMPKSRTKVDFSIHQWIVPKPSKSSDFP